MNTIKVNSRKRSIGKEHALAVDMVNTRVTIFYSMLSLIEGRDPVGVPVRAFVRLRYSLKVGCDLATDAWSINPAKMVFSSGRWAKRVLCAQMATSEGQSVPGNRTGRQ
jgi:hypothetical protein